VSSSDLVFSPAIGTVSAAQKCGDKCTFFVWTGDLAYQETITFTTIEAQSTKGGEEGTIYTATAVVTDSLGGMVTDPVTGTATGKVTHFANLIPTKSAPAVIGRGQLLTYTIQVWNSALSTDEPPYPVLTDVVPLSTTLVSVSDGGASQVLTDSVVVSWTLPGLGTGEKLVRSFVVLVDNDLVSGTQIINSDYSVAWREAEITTTTAFSVNVGQPVTVTVKEVGLVDSYKTVEPMIVSPGSGNVLTYHVHIVNSSPLDLTDVQVYDYLPWQTTTYQRDAVASAGDVYSDIVSVWWSGDVAAFSSQVVTLTVEVDPDYQGAITNTAVISHPELLTDVVVSAISYVTDEPVLHISKSASPDPVAVGGELTYQIQVVNLGQQATDLVITDTIPANTTYVDDSATAGGQLAGDEVRWEALVLEPGESRTFVFQVTVDGGEEIVNDRYTVRCAEGVIGIGAPVMTKVSRGSGDGDIYLPLVLRNAQ
jgi:uncharacterized repeat protein (TIGR01451 family)